MIRLSNAEINPLTALALDLQSSKSPSLFRRSYVYPFDHDKFDSSRARFPSLSLVQRRYHRDVFTKNYEEEFAIRAAFPNLGPRLPVDDSYQTIQLNYETSITRASWSWLVEERETKGLKREGTSRSISSPDGRGIDSQVLSRPKVTMCIDVSISLQVLLAFGKVEGGRERGRAYFSRY